jgi:hypothetical protein
MLNNKEFNVKARRKISLLIRSPDQMASHSPEAMAFGGQHDR